jgi:Glycosyltransferase family 87
VFSWRTLFGPIFSPSSDPVDFFEVYVPTGAMIASGQDPYSQCLSRTCWIGLTNAWTDYPPVVSWLSQPLALVDHATLGAAALVVAQACVAVFIWAMARALRVHGWQPVAIFVIAAIAFPPLIDQIVQRNLEVLLLGVSGVWLLGWVAGDRWWAGASLGLGLAIKLVQAPLLLLGVWGRRRAITVVAILVVAVLWAIGSPQYLPEYFLRIVPELNTGTGYAMDIAPVGALARLFHPASIYGLVPGVDTTVRIIAAAISATVLIMTAITLWSPRADRTGRGLEAAAVVAATPLIVAVVRPGHLLLLLLPMLVLGTFAIRERHLWLGVAVAASWMITGPAYLWYTNLYAQGLRGPLMAAGAELALLGTVILWLTSLWALRLAPSLEENRAAAVIGRKGVASGI